MVISLRMVNETMIVDFTRDRWGAGASWEESCGGEGPSSSERGLSLGQLLRLHRQKCRGAKGFSMEKSRGVGWCRDCHRQMRTLEGDEVLCWPSSGQCHTPLTNSLAWYWRKEADRLKEQSQNW